MEETRDTPASKRANGQTVTREEHRQPVTGSKRNRPDEQAQGPLGSETRLLGLGPSWCIRTRRPRPTRMTGRLLIGLALGRSDHILDGRPESSGQGRLFPRWSQAVEV